MAHEMAIRGTHARVLNLLTGVLELRKGMCVLDIGAGQGAFTARLKDAGLSVSACDFVPEQFDVPDVECKRCDETGVLPFGDGEFELAVAVEVLEHIDGHDHFFAEVSRVLAPNGTLMFTTPNILSLKSRMRFLFTGCYYSFDLLAPFTKDPVGQHISPFTVNRYEWMLSQHGLSVSNVMTDKMQSTSLLLSFLAPFIKLRELFRPKRRDLARAQSTAAVLFGRKLVIVARKRSVEELSELRDSGDA